MVASRKIGPATVTFRKEHGAAPTLVCIHGSADNHHVYDELLDALPGHARYAINMPGRAGADGPPLTSVREMEAFLAVLAVISRACYHSFPRTQSAVTVSNAFRKSMCSIQRFAFMLGCNGMGYLYN